MKRWKKLAAKDKKEREPELAPQNALWSGDK
ncbi:peptide ABC transporter, permease protein [Vibrio parahaemolyticus]|nr:peptide ABC transporter, permease protein [Vibrio parahaemolyticus]